MENVYIGRQPILDDRTTIFAYEILYRDKDKKSFITNERTASVAVIHNILNIFGTKEVLKEKRAFVKIDEKFLMSDLIFSVPNTPFVFSLFSNVTMDEKVIERIEQLHEKGYTLAVTDSTLEIDTFMKYNAVFRKFSYFKVDFSQRLSEEISQLIAAVQECGIKIIGSKIETRERFEYARESGCDYFQGYYFSKPMILHKKKIEPGKMAVLKLYNLLMQDVNIDEITDEFEANPEITVRLLQFMNSSAFHFQKKISSIHHVLTLLGRIKVAQWLMLMIYSKSVSTDGEHNPLMLLVQNRTRLMELLLKLVRPQSGSNALGEAYLVGILSLLDVVFEMELDALLDILNLSDEVKKAILNKEGLLGEIFALVEDIEHFDIDKVTAFEKKYDLPQQSVKKALLECAECEHRFGL